MYRQGNYTPHFRKGPPTLPPQLHQGPPPFPQGLPPPPPPVIQQSPTAEPPHVVHPGPPPTYQHAPPAPPHLVQQGGTPPPPPPPSQSIQVPTPVMVNTGQPYLHPPPAVYGSSPMTLSYPSVQQNAQYPSPVPPPLRVPVPRARPSYLEMNRCPLPPTVLPPPPSQGQMLYRTSLHPPPPPPPCFGNSLQHGRLLPPPPPSSFVPVTPAPGASCAHSPFEDAHPPSMTPPPPPPPPPPSSPPPLPPSPPPPPPASSPNFHAPLDADACMFRHLESDSGTDKPSDDAERVAISVDKVLGPASTIDDLPVSGTSCDMDSMNDGFSSKMQGPLALPPPPPKPVEEDIVQRIEVLCQFIAKNGPGFEDIAREKEIRNPKFTFLFGGAPGTEAAIAYEYFQWMKKKCDVESKLHNVSEQNDSSMRRLEIQSSTFPNNFTNEDAFHSPADSDMDMGEHDQSMLGRPFAKDHSPVVSSAGATECALNNSIQKFTGPLTEDLSLSGASRAAVSNSYKEVPSPLIKAGSPFRLIQDYASDDSEEDDNGPPFEDVSPVRVLAPVTVGNTSLHEDAGTNLDTNVGSKNVSETGKGLLSLTESRLVCPSMPSRMLNVSPKSPVLEATVVVSDPLDTIAKAGELQSDDHEDQQSNGIRQDASRGNVDIDPQSGNFHKENAKQDSPVLKVDEFGRLVREGATDSDSDGAHYSGRRARRGRSRSRSRSPRDRWRRSRSPRRRKEKRNRSRSWSPKKQSRKKSPSAFRHTVDFGGDKMRRDRDQIPDCFDFLRGKCYRGASCRFLHRGSATGDAARRFRSRQQQYLEGPQDMENSVVRGDSHFDVETHEIDNLPAKMLVDKHDTCLIDVKNTEMPCGDLSVSSTDVPKDGGLVERTESVSAIDVVQPVISIEIGRSPDTLIGKVSPSDSQEVIPEGPEKQQVQQVLEGVISIEVGRLPDVIGKVGQSDSQEVIADGLEKQQVQLVLEGDTVQENKISKQPEETSQPLVADNVPIQTVTDVDTGHFSGETPPGEPTLGENSVIQPSQADVPLSQPSQANVSFPLAQAISQPSPVQTSTTFPDQCTSNPYPNNIPSTLPYPNSTDMSQTGLNQIATSQSFRPESFSTQPLASNDFHPTFSSGDFHFQPPQLPLPPPFPQDFNAPQVSQQPKDYNNLTLVATNNHRHSAPMEGLPPYQAPLHNQLSTPVPSKSSWTSLPPPPSYVNELTPTSVIHTPGFHPLQFQQNPIPPRNDFPQPLMRPYPHEDPSHSQAVEFHPQTFPSSEEPHRPPFHTEDFRSRTLPMDNMHSQPLGGPTFLRDAWFTRSAMPEGKQFHPGPLQDSHSHPQTQLLEEHHLPHRVHSDVQNFQPLLNQRFASHFPHQDFMASSSFGQQQRSSFGLQPSVPDSFPSHLGAHGNVDPSISRYQSSFLDRNKPSQLSVIGGSKNSNSTHYNPFASTFEQTPGSSQFNSSLREEIDKNYGSRYDSFGLHHDSVGGQAIGGLGSRQLASPQDSSRAGGLILPRSGVSLQIAPSVELNNRAQLREPSGEGFPDTHSQFMRLSRANDRYDPLFDSIEPSSNTFRKFDHVEERDLSSDVINKPVTAGVTNDSVTMLRISSSHRLVDTKERDGADMAPATSPQNDEFGETAIDAEVGAVENESPVNLIDDVGNTALGDIEIDQVQSKGKGKKSKDSRSMKLLKVALADFVKEVLKPSWRQGNMSKEAFKTIVKKTVDKVSGAMKNHQIPKSQAKINQYVESSQRKLTKLVMGYVDKYVKV